MNLDEIPRFLDGRPIWHGMNGEALSHRQANELLADVKKRRVGQTVIRDKRERIIVSTIFMPIDMGGMEMLDSGVFERCPDPVLWETMVFGGSEDGVQMRYASRPHAKQGHRAISAMVGMVVAVEQAGRARRRRMHADYRARWS